VILRVSVLKIPDGGTTLDTRGNMLKIECRATFVLLCRYKCINEKNFSNVPVENDKGNMTVQ
jgi:hypothetical protein